MLEVISIYMKIFILEDDELISANFERIILENFDAHISQSYNLKDFSTKYVDDDFDILIMDIMIENTNVLEVINKYVSWNKPIVFITAFPNSQILNFTKNYKNAIILIKPIHELSLLGFIIKYQEAITNNKKEFLTIGTSLKHKELVPFEQINFVDVRGNYSIINTDTNKFILKKSVSKLVTESKGQLIKMNKCLAVNVKFINQINKKNGILKIMDKKFVVSDKYFKYHNNS